MLTRVGLLNRSILLVLSFAMSISVQELKGAPAPPWQLLDLNGKPVSLSDFKGKVVILDFWATWCPPCREEIPHFIDLQKRYGNQGLAVVGISLDQGGPEVVASFVKDNGINYPVVMANDEVPTLYGNIEVIPTTFVINPTGEIVKQYVGLTDISVIEGDVKKLLPSR